MLKVISIVFQRGCYSVSRLRPEQSGRYHCFVGWIKLYYNWKSSMMIQDVSISQTRRLPLLIIAPWSCGRWGTRWTSDDESSREDWACLSRRLGSAFEWHDTEAYRGAADCTDSVNHRWHFFLFLLCNYINNMFGVNLGELTGGGWKIHSFPPFFFFYLLLVFTFDCFQAVWCDNNSHKNTHSNNNRLITLIFHPSCLQKERSDAQLSRLIVSPILFKVQRRKWKHILLKNWEKVRKKQSPDNTIFFFKQWFTVSSVEATSRHQSMGREHDAVISANKPVHVVHHNDNIASTECSCFPYYDKELQHVYTYIDAAIMFH